MRSGVKGLCCERSIPAVLARLEEAIPLLGVEGCVLQERPDRQQTGMLPVFRLFMWLLARAGAVPWVLSWLGGSARGSCLVPDVLVSFQQSRYVVHPLPFREVVQRECKQGGGPWSHLEAVSSLPNAKAIEPQHTKASTRLFDSGG